MALLPDAFHIEPGDALKLSHGATWACVTVGNEYGRTVKVFFEDYAHIVSFAHAIEALVSTAEEASDGGPK